MTVSLSFSHMQQIVLQMMRPFNMSLQTNACIPLTGAISSAIQKMGLRSLIEEEPENHIAERISLIESYNNLLATDIIRKFLSLTLVVSAIVLRIISSSLGFGCVAFICITALTSSYKFYNNRREIENLQTFDTRYP